MIIAVDFKILRFIVLILSRKSYDALRVRLLAHSEYNYENSTVCIVNSKIDWFFVARWNTFVVGCFPGLCWTSFLTHHENDVYWTEIWIFARYTTERKRAYICSSFCSLSLKFFTIGLAHISLPAGKCVGVCV